MFCKERVKSHNFRLVIVGADLFFAQEEVHIYFLLTFLNLSSDAIYRLVKDFENI